MAETRKEYKRRRLKALRAEFNSFKPLYKLISENLLPIGGRFFVEDRNKGHRRNKNILESTALDALEVYAAGMMAGNNSPSRPWFVIESYDDDLNKFKPVANYFHRATQACMAILAGSTYYSSAHSMYEEKDSFATACAIMQEDFHDVVRWYPQTVGEYMIAQNDRGVVDTLYREFQMQVGAMAKKFDIKNNRENFSQPVLDLYDNSKYDEWITVVHSIEPREDRDTTKHDNLNMSFGSSYWEKDATDEKFLSKSGYKRFPALTPRSQTRGGDIYGTFCPGIKVIGDVLQLYEDNINKAYGIEQYVRPALQIPTSMQGREDVLPGGHSYYDPLNPHGGIRKAYEFNFDLNFLLQDMGELRHRIEVGFHKNLFQMISQRDRSNVTARQIAEEHEEKLIVLGPTLERDQKEFQGPAVEFTFFQGHQAGLFGEPPPELEGKDIRVRYVSMFAQAQKAIGLGSSERFLGTVASVGEMFPVVRHKINPQEIVDDFADMYGVPPGWVYSNEKATLIQRKEEDKQAQAEPTQNIPATAQAAKVLSETDTQGDNALTDITRQFTQL